MTEHWHVDHSLNASNNSDSQISARTVFSPLGSYKLNLFFISRGI